MGVNPAAARRWLWAGAALAVAGWAVAFVGAAGIGEGPFLLQLAALPAGIAVIAAGVSACWRGFARSRYAITPGWPGALQFAVAVAVSAMQIGLAVRSGLSSPDSGWGEWLYLGNGILMLVVATLLLFQLRLLAGDPRGLVFPSRFGIWPVRVPWADIERVVFSSGLVANTIEIGVALRPEARPRRSKVRRHDVLTDLPCRVVVPRKRFDFAGLQRLVAAHPQVTLVERAAGMERVWQPMGAGDEVRV